MTSHEQKRAFVLNQVNRGDMTASEAAVSLEVSVRQVRRLLARYRAEGVSALAHGNRGQVPAHALPAAVRVQVVTLAQGEYAGCNQQHFTELLAEREGLRLSRSSVRRILVAAGLSSPRPRQAPRHRRRRERRAQAGALVQLDASRHDWLQGRGPWLSLVGAIDDATGRVLAVCFREQEDAHGYFRVLEQLVLTYGCPLAVYHDRHSIFIVPVHERETLAEQLAGYRQPTQVGRLLAELGIAAIPARSPQAKGRIERLWGTFQDRLVQELRLAEATTLADANRCLTEFVPRYNARFAVPAVSPEVAYRSLPADFVAERVFCFKYTRTVAADNTVSYAPHVLQLLPDAQRASYAKAQVELHERLDGSLAIYYQGRCLRTQPAPASTPTLRARGGPRPPVLAPTPSAPPTAARPRPTADQPAARPAVRKPAATHPWRQPFVGATSRTQKNERTTQRSGAPVLPCMATLPPTSHEVQPTPDERAISTKQAMVTKSRTM